MRLAPRRTAVAAVGLLAAGGTLAAITLTAGSAAGQTTERVAGADRVATAIALANDSAPGASAQVVIARADVYADALAGAPLAGFLGAPLLLTGSSGLDDRVATEVRRLSPARVVLLGGTDALSPQVERDLAASGVTQVDRLAGVDRYGTSAAIAESIGIADTAYVVQGADLPEGRGWADAVSISGLAAFQGAPLLLVAGDSVPAATSAALRQRRDDGLQSVTIVGGTSPVSTAVEEQVRQLLGAGVTVDRVAGLDRYTTSVKVADRSLAAGVGPRTTFLATGSTFADALAAGPAAANEEGVLLLSRDGELPTGGPTADWLRDHQAQIERVVLVGGTAAPGS